MNSNVVLLGIGISLVGVASILSIICVVTDSWITFKHSSVQGNLGLWKYCAEPKDQENVCEDILG